MCILKNRTFFFFSKLNAAVDRRCTLMDNSGGTCHVWTFLGNFQKQLYERLELH